MILFPKKFCFVYDRFDLLISGIGTGLVPRPAMWHAEADKPMRIFPINSLRCSGVEVR